MPSRRTHSKSRHGCAQCKAVHVKCDLRRPVCGKCTKTRKNCEFGTPLDSQSSITPTTLHGQSAPEISPLPAAISLQVSTNLRPEFGLPSDVISWDDLELLHHYSTVTYTTLASRDDLLQMWKFEVPRMAFKQRFLMHSLLSVAALHMASAKIGNQTSYVDKAIRHHNIALKEYSSNLDRINQENSAALFTCATLIVVFALSLAVTQPHDEVIGSVEEISSIFMLLRGVPVILEAMWPAIEESEIAPMFSGREVNNATPLSDDINGAIRQLENRNRFMWDADCNRETYSLAIQALKECFKRASSKKGDDGMVLSWPIMVGPDYIALLASRRPLALVILAHYAVILHGMRDTWWARAWGQQLVQDVHRMVDDEWKTLTAWPMKMVI